jgi:hypothetical protein
MAEAEKGAKVLDIMLNGRDWYGGVCVSQGATPIIEVLVVAAYPGKLSAFVPPRIGGIPVMVRFGVLPEGGIPT